MKRSPSRKTAKAARQVLRTRSSHGRGVSKGREELRSSRSLAQWTKQRYAQQPERKSSFESLSFKPVPALATPEAVPQLDYARDLAYPGEYPYTRGVQPSMYRGRLWTMRQFAGFGTPEDTNRRFHYLLAQGQTGLSTAFDMPSLMGYDPDHTLSRGEVGREGVSVACLDDMRRLFKGIDQAKVSTSMTINCTAGIALAFYFALARSQGHALSTLAGTLQNDMLKEFIAQKEWICPPQPSVKLSMDVVEFCARHAPRFNAISVSGYHIREAGATAVQELAFTLADGLEYVKQLCDRGLAVDQFAPRISFFFDVHNDFFEEVAKFRAARRLWARCMRARFKARSPRSLMLRTHAQTAGVSLTAQQPLNNVVRVSLQALAAVLGGVQSLHTNAMDETLALPSEASALLALRTQQIIAEESGVADTIDALAGSYYVEQLTDQLEQEALALIEKIDQMGGMLAAVEQGFPQREIAESAYTFQRRVESGQRVVVGVNKYQSTSSSGDTQEIPLLHVDMRVERQQIRRIQNMRRQRSAAEQRLALQALRRSCKQGRNVMPALIQAAQAGATLGELSDVYREVFGNYRDPGLW
jgi:methylmalonyl-CoA mutase N-terminal domain/subunit